MSNPLFEHPCDLPSNLHSDHLSDLSSELSSELSYFLGCALSQTLNKTLNKTLYTSLPNIRTLSQCYSELDFEEKQIFLKKFTAGLNYCNEWVIDIPRDAASMAEFCLRSIESIRDHQSISRNEARNYRLMKTITAYLDLATLVGQCNRVIFRSPRLNATRVCEISCLLQAQLGPVMQSVRYPSDSEILVLFKFFLKT